MSDDLQDLAKLSQMDDAIIFGGEAGGSAPKVLLRRSEIEAFRRNADRYPINSSERRDCVTVMMDIAKNAKSKRLRIGAVKAVTAMDKLNIEEVKTVIAAKVATQPKSSSGESVIVNNQVTVNNITAQAVLDEYADVISAGAIPSRPSQDDDSGKSLYPAKTNGKAS